MHTCKVLGYTVVAVGRRTYYEVLPCPIWVHIYVRYWYTHTQIPTSYTCLWTNSPVVRPHNSSYSTWQDWGIRPTTGVLSRSSYLIPKWCGFTRFQVRLPGTESLDQWHWRPQPFGVSCRSGASFHSYIVKNALELHRDRTSLILQKIFLIFWW